MRPLIYYYVMFSTVILVNKYFSQSDPVWDFQYYDNSNKFTVLLSVFEVFPSSKNPGKRLRNIIISPSTEREHPANLSRRSFNNWDGVEWFLLEDTKYIFNSNGQLVEQVWRNYEDLNIPNDDVVQHYYYEYGENGLLTECLMKFFEEDDTKYVVEYNSEDKVSNYTIFRLYNSWDENEWRIWQRYIISYPKENLITYYYTEWDQYSYDYLITNHQHNIVYNEDKLLSEIIKKKKVNDEYVNFYKYTYVYDEYKNLIETNSLMWNDSLWVNDYRVIQYFYSNDNLLLYHNTFRWIGGDFPCYQGKTEYEYDESKRLIESTRFNNEDEAMEKHTFSYNEDGNLKTQVLLYFSDSSNAWKNSSMYEYEYNALTENKESLEEIENFKLVQNYPNPFNPSATIKYSIPIQSNVTLKVFDALGSEVATLIKKEQSQGNYEVEFDGSDLTSGIYFYRLQAGDYVETKKMILLK